MIENPEKIKGKTYSLFGNYETTDSFFKFINEILDELLTAYEDELKLLRVIQNSSKNKKNYEIFVDKNKALKDSITIFRNYVTGVEEHLEEQSLLKFWKSDLKLKEWQYHLYMLEFALTNRIFKDKFVGCNVKIALLPHCLRDLSKECKAAMNGFDYQCRHCSKNCFINETSRILKNGGVEPYLWMTADLKKMAKKNFKEKKSLGVLGIACIPQLVRGMRMCEKKKIPVIGLPLNANRCIRWMGDFYPNSINLNELKMLIRDDSRTC
jgi:uncharacterized protein